MKRRNLLKLGVLGSVLHFVPKAVLAPGDMIDDCTTTVDIEGPFYTPNAPKKTKLSPNGAKGTPLFITGTVYSLDCETPVPYTSFDVWQADANGAYDNTGFNYRGKFSTDVLGNYSFESILPGKYLNGNYYRPRHIHFKIQGYTSEELITQLYFEGDTSIPIDQWASGPKAEGRIIPLSEDSNGYQHGVFDVYLDIDPKVLSANEYSIQNNSGNLKTPRIISISPNPVKDNAELKFYLNNNFHTEIILFDLQGRYIRKIYSSYLKAGINSIGFNSLNSLGLKINTGIYILQLIIDGSVTDAKRLVII